MGFNAFSEPIKTCINISSTMHITYMIQSFNISHLFQYFCNREGRRWCLLAYVLFHVMHQLVLADKLTLQIKTFVLAFKMSSGPTPLKSCSSRDKLLLPTMFSSACRGFFALTWICNLQGSFNTKLYCLLSFGQGRDACGRQWREGKPCASASLGWARYVNMSSHRITD